MSTRGFSVTFIEELTRAAIQDYYACGGDDFFSNFMYGRKSCDECPSYEATKTFFKWLEPEIKRVALLLSQIEDKEVRSITEKVLSKGLIV